MINLFIEVFNVYSMKVRRNLARKVENPEESVVRGSLPLPRVCVRETSRERYIQRVTVGSLPWDR